MNIVCCLDDGFVMPCGVLLISICENNKEEDIVFHIVSEGLKQENQNELNLVAEKYERSIYFYRVEASLLKNCPLHKEFQAAHMTLSAYYRLLLASILPDNIEKVLYLDCDIVVCDSLKDLWEIDIADYAVGAVPDCIGDSILHYNRLDYDFSLGYFNSGVLLMNLTYWKKHNVEYKLLEYISLRAETLDFFDQDALNYVLREEKKELPMRYNVMDQFFWHLRNISVKRSRWQDMFVAVKSPVIIHYTTSSKPWHKDSVFYLKNIWIKYYKLSVWKDIPFIYKIPKRKRLLSTIRNILVVFRLVKPPLCRYRDGLPDISKFE